MKKSNKRRKKYKIELVEALAQKYGVTTRFVTMSISGDRHSETSTTIRKKYVKADKQIDKILETI